MKSKPVFFIRVTTLALLVLVGSDQAAGDSTKLNFDLGAAFRLAEFLEQIREQRQPLTISIKPTETGTIATCQGDDPVACDLLAASCEELGGVGQCGGPENPSGCQ